MFCPEGEYSEYGQLFFTPLTQSLRLILHLGEPFPLEHDLYEFNSGLLVLYVIFVYVLMTWTYGVGAATGLFVPSLTVGAATGRFLGRYELTTPTWFNGAQSSYQFLVHYDAGVSIVEPCKLLCKEKLFSGYVSHPN